MDSDHFDQLAKSFTVFDTRRGVVRLLTALPFGVALSTILHDDPDAIAKGGDGDQNRKRGRHKHRDLGKGKTARGTCGQQPLD